MDYLKGEERDFVWMDRQTSINLTEHNSELGDNDGLSFVRRTTMEALSQLLLRAFHRLWTSEYPSLDGGRLLVKPWKWTPKVPKVPFHLLDWHVSIENSYQSFQSILSLLFCSFINRYIYFFLKTWIFFLKKTS